MKVVVTGGAGFIGSHVVELFLSKGHKVVVIDDFSAGKKENLLSHENLTICNLSVTENVEQQCEGADVIVHLAANPAMQYSIQHPLETSLVNLFGTINMLDIARRQKIKRFVFGSSCAVYGDPEVPTPETAPIKILSPYAEQKWQSERWCTYYQNNYDLSTIILRFFNVYGPRQNNDSAYAGVITKWINLIRNNQQPAVYGDGEQTRDFVHVTDVAQAIYQAATSIATGTYNIGSGQGISINQALTNVLKMLNSSIKPQLQPALEETRDSKADITKAKTLGWQPKMSFEEGIQTLR